MPDVSPYDKQASAVAQEAAPLALPARQPPFVQRHWHKLVALAFWGALLGVYGWYLIRHDMAFWHGVYVLVELLQTPYYGPLLYIAVFALRPLVFFSAALLTVVAGSVFGPLWGFVLTVVASNVSATVAYTGGRFLGRGMLDDDDERMAGRLMRRYAGPLRRNSFETVLAMNLLFLPFDLINYLAGFLRIAFRPFLLATIVGSLPGIVGCVLLGSSIMLDMEADFMLPTLHPGSLVVSLVVLAISVVLSRVLKRRERRQAG